MAKHRSSRSIIKNVIKKHSSANKKEISQLTIKIDKRLDNALVILSTQISVSKNRLI